MNLPGTFASLLVIVLGVLPGMPGETVYRWIGGANWRERDYRHVLRLLGFSVIGLAFYALAAAQLGLPLPAYAIPATFTGGGLEAADLPSLGVAYVGHATMSVVAAGAAAGITRLVGLVAPIAHHRDAWDAFVNFCVAKHWVLVTLSSGESYAGVLAHADVAVEPEYRDIVLEEPFRFDVATKGYEPTFNQFLFIRGVDIGSIAAVYDEVLDAKRRVVAVSANPFPKRPSNAREEQAESTIPPS